MTLADQSAVLSPPLQAAHWFDHARSRLEFARILKPFGWLVLLGMSAQRSLRRFSA